MRILLFILRKILSLRYSVELKGTEILKSGKTKLFLPNHQAAVLDPTLLVSNIYRFTSIVPVVTDTYYNMPILHTIFKKWGAVEVNDIYKGSTDVSVLKTIHFEMLSAINAGKNVVVYPAGQSAGQGYEKIFNKQSAHALVQNLHSDVDIIAVRISGLWGSMWSRAWTGRSPHLVSSVIKGVFIGILNLLIFIPKRHVTIEFSNVTDEAKRIALKSRYEFNNFLEHFYNEHGEEQVHFVKHYFYLPPLRKHLPKVIEESEIELQKTNIFDKSSIPQAIETQVRTLISKEIDIPESEISLSSHLYLDLGIDSLGLVTTLTKISEQFSTDFPKITEIKTVADICLVAMGRSVTEAEFPESKLHITRLIEKPVSIDSHTYVQEAIISIFSKNRKESFGWDAKTGSMNRKEFLLKALVVSKIIKKEVSGNYVGIMLPALQSTTLLITATYFANKIPVMLNWTVGKKTLNHCVNNVGIDTILTAEIFYEKVKEFIPDDVVTKLLFFEKKLPEITLNMKLTGLVQSLFPKKLIRIAPPNDTAVVLFTSGSETQPKTVPLSHTNILGDIKGVLDNIDMYNTTIMLNFLPPFHSFGFTVLNIFPLCTGIKIACTPDPTDTDTILNVIRHTKITFMAGTPTFLKMILTKGYPEDFQYLDFSISGAERLPRDVYNLYKEKTNGALLLEGYGITECSPIISFNPREKQVPNSVGKPINGIDIRIVDLSTWTQLPPNKEGMIIVSGPTVFSGYKSEVIKSPFITHDNKQFYITGDLGYFNEEGYLFISGRLKRFIKIAGEMISLPFIESVLLEKYGTGEEPVLAIEGTDASDKHNDKHKIVLFSKISIDIIQANKYLLHSGLPAIAKITEIRRVAEIPLLGSGKTNYKTLKAMI